MKKSGFGIQVKHPGSVTLGQTKQYLVLQTGGSPLCKSSEQQLLKLRITRRRGSAETCLSRGALAEDGNKLGQVSSLPSPLPSSIKLQDIIGKTVIQRITVIMSRWRLFLKNYFLIFFAYYFLKVHLHHFSKIKSQKEVTKQLTQGFSYFFCLMIEGSGSIPLTIGTGSRRSRNIWIRIRNTGFR